MNFMKDITSVQLINREKCSGGLVEGEELTLALSYISMYVGTHKLLL